MNPKSNYSHSWQSCILSLSSTIKEAIQNLDNTAMQIILVADKSGYLHGTLSDGDIRRGIMNGCRLEDEIRQIIQRKPLVVPVDTPQKLVLQLMSLNRVRQIPIVDVENRVIGLHLWDQLTGPQDYQNAVVIMAGGKGMRMRPYTESVPKPMLEVNGKPMLEQLIRKVKDEGFRNFFISVNYLANVIEEYFGSGAEFGVVIEYLRESESLGTAGSLSLLPKHVHGPVIVTNGDVVTDVRFKELMDFHLYHDADATMAVRTHEWRHPFGVVELDGLKITRIEEKPSYRNHVNAGIYALSTRALELLKTNEPCDMPGLFDRARSVGLKTIAYPVHESWIDVGTPPDLKIAREQSNLER